MVRPGFPLCRDEWPKLHIPSPREVWRRTYFQSLEDAQGHFDANVDANDSTEQDIEAAVEVAMDVDRQDSPPQASPSKPSRGSRRVVPLPLPDGNEPARLSPYTMASPSRRSELSPGADGPADAPSASAATLGGTVSCRPWWAPAGLFPCLFPIRPPFVLVAHSQAILRNALWLLLAVNILSKLAILRVYTERQQHNFFTIGILFFVAGFVAPVLASWRHLLVLYTVHGRVWIRHRFTKYELEDEPGGAGYATTRVTTLAVVMERRRREPVRAISPK